MMEKRIVCNEKRKFSIVIQAHNVDYISSTAYLTQASSRKETIINCMEYEDLGIDEGKYVVELTRLHSLLLHDLEQDDRKDGNV
jgi:hypothetical protein